MAGKKFDFADRWMKSWRNPGAILTAGYLAVGFIFLCLISGGPALAQSSSNGVYGGYVGSSSWFASTQRLAIDQAQASAANPGGAGGSQAALPPGYVGFSGQVVFPNGNPFPGGRLPDLGIRCRNFAADSVERAPKIDQNGAFYTVFKRGQTYDLYWIYYFGGREKFASIGILPSGPSQRRYTFQYVPQPRASANSSYQRPQAGPQYHPPQASSGWQPPRADSGWKPPQADSSWRPPH